MGFTATRPASVAAMAGVFVLCALLWSAEQPRRNEAVTVNVPQKAWQNVAIRTHDKAVKLARNLTRFPLPTRARVDVILSDAIGTPTFNKMRFFMLEFPFTSNYPKDAKNQGCRITPTKLGHRLGVLDQHWSRTYNMSEAILFFSECPIWRSGCSSWFKKQFYINILLLLYYESDY